MKLSFAWVLPLLPQIGVTAALIHQHITPRPINDIVSRTIGVVCRILIQFATYLHAQRLALYPLIHACARFSSLTPRSEDASLGTCYAFSATPFALQPAFEHAEFDPAVYKKH